MTLYYTCHLITLSLKMAPDGAESTWETYSAFHPKVKGFIW